MMHSPQGLIDLDAPAHTWGAPNWEGIAVSLSRINRWNGNTSRPYSVAEHSIRVARLLPPGLKLAGLVHDAAEAFIGDLPYPIRQCAGAGKFEQLDAKITLWIYESLEIRNLIGHPEIAEADRIMAATEYRDLCGGDPVAAGMVAPLAWRVGGQSDPEIAGRWLAKVLAGR
jgi:hypothetical protein